MMPTTFIWREGPRARAKLALRVAHSPMSGEKFERLTAIMARLRAPGGCPWDREQTFDTLRPYLVEETYEALDAIEREDWEHLSEELGDVLLQIVFQAQIAKEEGLFTIDDVVDAISDKLVRRHPHVFDKDSAETAGDVERKWEQIKAEEKAERGKMPEGVLDGVPRHQPALLEAFEIGKKAAKTGFDWERFEDLLDKLTEERGEIAEAVEGGDRSAIEDEAGDLLFVAVNICRYLGVHPEMALRRTNGKFRDRFSHVEKRISETDRTLDDATLEEMESLWQEAKSR